MRQLIAWDNFLGMQVDHYSSMSTGALLILYRSKNNMTLPTSIKRGVCNERNLVHLVEKSVEIKLKSWEIKADFLKIKLGNQPNPPAPPTFTTCDVIFEGNQGEIKQKSGNLVRQNCSLPTPQHKECPIEHSLHVNKSNSVWNLLPVNKSPHALPSLAGQTLFSCGGCGQKQLASGHTPHRKKNWAHETTCETSSGWR